MTSLSVLLRTPLTVSTEKNYAQIEKEFLVIVSCMDKWHQYLYGKCEITVHTDHQPLETKSQSAKPPQAAKNDAQITRISVHSPVQERKSSTLRTLCPTQPSLIATGPPPLASKNAKCFAWNWQKWISHQIESQPPTH